MSLSLSRARFGELLARAAGRRIVVVGDAMLDVYLTGDVERISPEAPVPVVRVRDRRHALGGACNVAQNVMAIGCQCDLVAAVGRDRSGETVRAMLNAIGVGTGALVAVDRPTTQKTRIVARSQQLVRVDEEEDADLSPPEIDRVLAAIRETISGADALVLEDYNKGVLVPTIIHGAMNAARAADIPVIVDPKFRNFFEFGGATIFKPNRRELEAALGANINIDHIEALTTSIARLGAEYLLLTLGDRGMVLASAEGIVGRVTTVAREVYDVVGAGDTVTAYLAAMLAAGGTAEEAAAIANVAAGIEVGKLGAATVSSAEVLAFVDEHGLHE